MKKLFGLILSLGLASVSLASEPDFKIVGTSPKKSEPVVVIPQAPIVRQAHPLGGANWHSHTCKACGTTWAHQDNSPFASHNCPSCGRPEFIQNPRVGTTTRQVVWR